MRPLLATALLVAQLGCGDPPHRPEERAVMEFVTAVRSGQCPAAYEMLSSEMKRALREEAKARGSSRSRAELAAMYCTGGVYDRVDLEKTHTESSDGRIALVNLVERVPAGHLIPGFWPTRVDERPMPMRAILEGSVWRVEHPIVLESLHQLARRRQEEERIRRETTEYNERLFTRMRKGEKQ
jgi:hypothetical protein